MSRRNGKCSGSYCMTINTLSPLESGFSIKDWSFVLCSGRTVEQFQAIRIMSTEHTQVGLS